jgi:EAL domain-containing protein (putative c-di-GMP-specific phosphodiesterase class I)
MSADAGRRLAIERALVGVIERGELSLCFQPQLDARDGTVVGVEALLRWNNPKLGAIAPDEIIPILEANGAIDRVGAWVLEEACRYGASWQHPAHPLRVGVNVSAHQLRDEAFSRIVDHAVEASGLGHERLELELTESVLVDNPESTRRVLEGLRSRGVRIAVDDFGTGYASLAYVRQFPMDTLKIDRQFVRGLPLDNESAAITSAIVALGQSLRLDVVAEGVETEAAEEFLFSHRCYVMQGYRHARPMPPADLAEWRRQRPWA